MWWIRIVRGEFEQAGAGSDPTDCGRIHQPQISEKLFVSPHTITTHRRNILQKLGANSTASVVMYAVQAGLVSPNKFLFAPEA